MARWLVAAVLIAGCKKEVVDTGPTGSCEDIVTESLTYVSAADYPPGLAEQLPLWRTLPGSYTANYCGRGSIQLKLDNLPPVEELQLVTQGIDERIPCGCTSDPQIADDDNALGAYAWAYGATVFLFDVSNDVDPLIVEEAINGVIVPVDWALLPPEAPLSMRGCAKVPVTDPTLTYTDATVVIRMDAAGGLSGTVDLTGDGESLTCELTEFVWIAEP